MFPLSLRVRVDGPLLLGPPKKNSIYFVELFPDDGLSGGSGVCVSPPERSLWLPPTEVSLLPCAFPLGLLGLFPVLLASLFPEEGLFGGSGV